MDNKSLVVESGKTPANTKKRSRPEQTVQFAPGEGGHFVGSALALMQMQPIDLDNAEQVGRRMEEFFTFCADNDVRPSVAGMALALGCSRNDLMHWTTRDTKPPAVKQILTRGLRSLDYLMDQYMQRGKINPVSGIFLMKNNFGYNDKQEVVVTPNNPFGEIQDKQTLEERYLDSIPSET